MSKVESGYAFIRKGKELDKKSSKIEGLLDNISVPINYWIDGYHLAQQIRTLFWSRKEEEGGKGGPRWW